MAKRDEFITIIRALRDASPNISNEQRKGFLRQAVQNYGLSVDEAIEILQSLGLTVGGDENYFEVLGFSINEFDTIDETTIANRIEASHKRLYSVSLRAGGRPRTDGRTEEQWRLLLNQARDVLINIDKRQAHLAMLETDVHLWTESSSDELTATPAQSISIPTEQDGMVLIPTGEFQMGCEDDDSFNDEKPVHTVFVDEFYMDKYPVTNAQFKEFIDEHPQWRKPSKWYRQGKNAIGCIHKMYHNGEYLKTWKYNNFPVGEGDHPVTWVSWYAAMAYAVWMGKRLPTEAEWEKAARGGLTGQKYPWGDTIDSSHVNFNLYVGRTTSIGKYPGNNYGLHDMIGNVYEWCLDKWDKNFYMHSPKTNPISGESITDIVNDYTEIKTPRILRGGSYVSTPQNVRVAYRARNIPARTCFSLGFRCVKPVRT